jgi:Flp pilus assembly pilin Flp
MRTVERTDQELGASSVEYAILVSLIALAIVVVLTAFGGAVASLYDVF